MEKEKKGNYRKEKKRRSGNTDRKRKGSTRASKAKFVLLVLEVDGNDEMTCG